VDADELERELQVRLNSMPKAARAEHLHVLMLADFDRADAIGAHWGTPRSGSSPSY
jgi:hypothetical protein